MDDGIYGLSYHNREGFTRMVADAIYGKIDLVITCLLYTSDAADEL